MIKSINDMRAMERHRYLTQNKKVCPSCKKEKSFKTFFDGDDIKDVCKPCSKKINERQVFLQVLKSLSKTEIELIQSIEGEI